MKEKNSWKKEEIDYQVEENITKSFGMKNTGIFSAFS